MTAKTPCRFCGRLYHPRGLHKAFEYCTTCSPERRAKAREKFYGSSDGWKAMTAAEAEAMGPYFSLSRLKAIRGEQ